MNTKHLPPSATHGGIAILSLIAFLSSLLSVKIFNLFETSTTRALFIVLSTATVIFVFEYIFLNTHRRASTGLDFQTSHSSIQRTLVKFLGLIGSIGFIAFLYWLFPEYHGDFYNQYYNMLGRALPYFIFLSIPYIYFVDRHQSDPLDSYYQVGQICLLNFKKIDWRPLKTHFLGWVIKGFFLPLMFTYLVRDIESFQRVDFSKMNSFKSYFDVLYDLIFTIDVGVVAMGYIMSFRLTDTHLRSAEPTMLGWVAALFCYQPFWSLFGKQYLDYDAQKGWATWFPEGSTMYIIWACGILFLFSIYVWGSLNFGCRFSNLTHRGILTNGPYRWTKHPAYISKCMAWWMISVPFLISESWAESLRRSLLLFALNGIYFIRARTEEKHLSLDPVYVQYSEWIKENGWISRLKDLIFLR